jgi:hypothetical protein
MTNKPLHVRNKTLVFAPLGIVNEFNLDLLSFFATSYANQLPFIVANTRGARAIFTCVGFDLNMLLQSSASTALQQTQRTCWMHAPHNKARLGQQMFHRDKGK